MENRKEFLQELYNLLVKYNVEINIGLDGDTHGLDSWISIDHYPIPNSFKSEEILREVDCIGQYELKSKI